MGRSNEMLFLYVKSLHTSTFYIPFYYYLCMLMAVGKFDNYLSNKQVDLNNLKDVPVDRCKKWGFPLIKEILNQLRKYLGGIQ